MAVLMEEVHSDGRRRQCNSRCHNAKLPKCRCVCGGRYHGGARDGTLEQRVEQFQKEFLEKVEPILREKAQLALGGVKQ